MSDIIKKWYEKKDNIDEMGQWNSNGLKRWEQFITAYFPVKAHILDVGCGMGREAFALSDMGFSVTGIDISEEAIEQVTALSRQKGYDALFTHYDGHYKANGLIYTAQLKFIGFTGFTLDLLH